MILKLNIATKSDIGTYSYDANKTHAVTQVLCNDYNYTGDYQQITYNSYNKATAINNYLFVSYGTDNQHIRTQTKSGSTVLKTKYFSGSYEKIIEGTTVKELHYISCDYGLIAIYEKTPTTGTMFYTASDHLGSITLLINPDGTKKDERNFDPWGRQRNPTTWDYVNVQPMQLTDRGYTGHACAERSRSEHLAAFDLINMNRTAGELMKRSGITFGRMAVYSVANGNPILGRMLSPDNYVQAPTYTQSYNRYSYVWNNPLKYTDPSGDYVAYGANYIFNPQKFYSEFNYLSMGENGFANVKGDGFYRCFYLCQTFGLCKCSTT